jgi:hypothetical protein
MKLMDIDVPGIPAVVAPVLRHDLCEEQRAINICKYLSNDYLQCTRQGSNLQPSVPKSFMVFVTTVISNTNKRFFGHFRGFRVDGKWANK